MLVRFFYRLHVLLLLACACNAFDDRPWYIFGEDLIRINFQGMKTAEVPHLFPEITFFSGEHVYKMNLIFFMGSRWFTERATELRMKDGKVERAALSLRRLHEVSDQFVFPCPSRIKEPHEQGGSKQ